MQYRSLSLATLALLLTTAITHAHERYLRASGGVIGQPVQIVTPKDTVAPHVLLGPKGVNRRLRQARMIHPPRGYGSAWEDGRLSPLRGVGTRAGQAQMNRFWTNTVPRRLVEQ